MLSTWQIFIVLGIVILFFGPSRLEKLGPALGKAIRGFKQGLEDPDGESTSKGATAAKIVNDAEAPNDDSKDLSKT